MVLMLRKLVFLLLLCSGVAQAHNLAPSLLQLTEQAPGLFDVYWKTPRLSSAGQRLEPIFPPHCQPQSQSETRVEGTGLASRWLIKCQQAMAGETISVDGMQATGTPTLVKIQWLAGDSVQSLINANSPQLSIPAVQSGMEVAGAYIVMGAEHIWLGIDHLLFVLALLMLVRSTKKLLWTITAFTVGHSITLSLVSLGYMDYPVALVEFTIALSILVLAIELSRPEQGKHWISDYSWLVAISFGLLHGMGFAGALREVGLPAGDIPLALFSFNVGIELGQVAFVLVCLGAAALLARTIQPVMAPGRWIVIYAIGSLSAFWCIERGLSVILTA